MAHTEILKPRTLHTNLKGQGLPQLIVFSQLPIEFKSQNYSVVNRNQTSRLISIIPNFLAGFVQKTLMTKIKLFSVTSVNFGFISNVTNLIIQIADIFRTVMNPGIVQIVAAQFFFLTPYQATQISWLVGQTLIATSHSGDIQNMIIITHYH